MALIQIVFLILAAVSLAAAIQVVSAQNLVHAALWLIVTLFGVAALYAILEAGFLAVVQVVVYIGAIAILFIFAVMLTRRVAKDSGPQTNPGWPLAAVIAAALFAGLWWMLAQWSGFGTTAAGPVVADADQFLRQLGSALVSPDAYVLPFELASVLLVAAMIGAIWVAWERK